MQKITQTLLFCSSRKPDQRQQHKAKGMPTLKIVGTSTLLSCAVLKKFGRISETGLLKRKRYFICLFVNTIFRVCGANVKIIFKSNKLFIQKNPQCLLRIFCFYYSTVTCSFVSRFSLLSS